MIRTDSKTLYRKLDLARRLMRNAKNSDERLALVNYIGNLYHSIYCLGEKNLTFDHDKSFGGKKNYKKFMRKLDIYTDRLLQNYVSCKDFHQSFFGEILPEIEASINTVLPSSYDVDSQFTKADFLTIVHDFMSSLKLEDLWNSFYQNGNIYSTVSGTTRDNLGFTLYNPINGDIDLFVKDFQYDMESMNTLVHEMGHGYDLSRFDGSIIDYNHYFYLSFYGEVVSRLFERLLFRYLLKNNIKKDTVKDRILFFEDLNHDLILQSYILSLLDENFFIDDDYLDFTAEEIAKMVKKYFLEDADIQGFISQIDDMNLSDVYSYSYGDIISIFLCDAVEEDGFDTEIFSYFLDNRKELFQESFMRECGFGPGNYIKQYRKELNLLKR